MRNLKLSILAMLFVFINTFGQEKGIYLTNKKTKDSTFISENKRVKIKLKSGKKIVGRLKIIDEKNISIGQKNVALERIEEIRKASIFHAIIDPIAKIATSISALGLLLSLSGLPYTSNLEPGPLLMATFVSTIPYIKNNHPITKYNYRIENIEPKTDPK